MKTFDELLRGLMTYPTRNYATGDHLLTLRNRAQLTQAELAARLGLHRRSIQKWESGESHPTAEHLRTLVALLIDLQVFAPGRERTEAGELWQRVSDGSPHHLPPFDTTWFESLLAGPATAQANKPPAEPHPPESSVAYSLKGKPLTVSGESQLAQLSQQTLVYAVSTRIDWGLAPDVPALYGRSTELATLTQWGLNERCRVVTLLGMGGIGKTSLALTFARQAAPHFERVIFRSLGEAPPFSDLLDHLIQWLAVAQVVTPPQPADQLALVVQLLREQRCLLVLDNLETLLQTGAVNTQYRAGYELYGTLFRLLGETAHQSCLLLTSREQPPGLAALMGSHTPVRTLRVSGLPIEACQVLLADQNLTGSAADAAALAHLYDGNPLALKLVGEPIRGLFQRDIAAFLSHGALFFDGVGQLLAQQIERASALEQAVLTWLAIGREPVSLDLLMTALAGGYSKTVVLAALHTLWQRNLIELGQASLTFTLQPVVLEYLTEHLVGRAVAEILQGNLVDLLKFMLVQATAKEYVRHSQERLIAGPLLEQLTVAFGGANGLEQQLCHLLAAQRNRPVSEQGYGPGNLINLLRLLRGDLRGLDLSRFAIRQAYLQGVALQDASLAHATIQETIFTDTFDAPTAIAISRTGEEWAAISRLGELMIWRADGRAGKLPPLDVGHQSLQLAWPAHTALVWTLSFSPNGATIASGGWEGAVKVWEVATGRLRWVARHTSHINRVAFDPAGSLLASSGNDATVRLWDAESGTEHQTLTHPGPVAVVAWSPTGVLLATADLDGSIRLWVRQEHGLFVFVQTLAGHRTWVDGLAFSPDGRTLASASYDGTVRLWEIASPPDASQAETTTWGQLRQTLATHSMHRIGWSPDGRILAMCSFERMIWLWDVEEGALRPPLQGHTDAVYDLAFTRDGQTLISGSQDGTLRLWEVGSGVCVRVMAGYTGSIFAVDWSPDGTQLVSVGADGLVALYSMTDKTAAAPSLLLHRHTSVVFGVGWSPNGRWLASSELDNAILLWDAATGEALPAVHHPEDATNLFYGLAWSPDGQILAAGTAGRGVLVWDVAANCAVWASPAFATKIRHVAWDPSGSMIAGGGDDGVVYIWSALDGALLHQLTGHLSMITCLAWNLDGTCLASGGRGKASGELFVWDVRQGEQVASLSGHAEIVTGLAWGVAGEPGQELLISAGGGGKLRWWEVESGQCVRIVEAHEGAIGSLRRSPDGALLASCGDDGLILVWDLHTGSRLRTIRRDRPYERLDITGVKGLTAAQRSALLALGAVERSARSPGDG